MKIIIITPNYNEGHSWMKSSVCIAEYMQKAGHEVVVVTANVGGKYLSEEICNGVKVYRVKSWFIPAPFNVTVPPAFVFHLRRIIMKENPQAFVVSKYMFFTSLSVFYLKLARSRKIVLFTDTFPGMNWYAPSKVLNLAMWIYARTLGWAVLKTADKVVLLHENNVPTAKALGLNYEVIHNGIDFDRYQNVVPAKDILKFKNNAKAVVFVGRLDDVKGYKNLLKVSELLEKEKDLKFVLVCGDKYKDMREELAKKHKNCLFLSFRADIPEILSACDIYVIPSYSEGLPNTLMESMATGLPSIATNVGGIPCLIEEGKTGFLISHSENLEEMTLAILNVKKNLQKMKDTVGKAGREKIEKEFNSKNIVKQWEKVLSENI